MRFMTLMTDHADRIRVALYYFVGPSIVVAVVMLLLARWIGSDWLRPPVDTKDYLSALLTAGGILAALASVQVQILHTLRTLLPNPKNVLRPAIEFTKLAAWMFAGGVPVIIITLVLGLSDPDFIGAETIIAGLQYLVLGLFTAGWVFLYAGSIQETS